MAYPHWRRTALPLFVISALTACQPVAPIADPIAFTFQGGANSSTILVSVRNAGDEAVFLERCGDRMLPAVERRSEDAWVNTAAAICPASLRMDPIRLEAGAVHQESLGKMQPGTYRLVLGISRSSAVPFEFVASQSFAIE